MAGEKRQRGGAGSGGSRGGNEDRSAKRRRYAAAAGKSKAKAAAGEIRGPGLWLSCARRKEAISTSEAYDLLNDVADRLYPGTSTQTTQGSSKDLENHNIGTHDEVEDDIEARIAKELEELQPATDLETGKKKMRFQGVRTDTECLIWISCAPPLDPVKLTYTIADDLQTGGPVRTRFLQRITPVTNTTHADPNSLKRLAYRILQPLIAPTVYTLEQRDSDEPIKYRIEPSLRNHTSSLNRQVVTDIIGEVVRDLANAHFQFAKPQVIENDADDAAVQPQSPGRNIEKEQEKDDSAGTPQVSTQTEEPAAKQSSDQDEEQDKSPAKQEEGEDQPAEETPWHILPAYRRRIFVDLKNPTHTILVSALRGVCGISVVEGYDQRKKFNVQMLGGNLHAPANGRSKAKEEDNANVENYQPEREAHNDRGEALAQQGDSEAAAIGEAAAEQQRHTQKVEEISESAPNQPEAHAQADSDIPQL